MEYRALGSTGIKVSLLGFGGAPIGLQGYLGHEDRDDPAFQAAALAAIRHAVQRGINLFDTSPAYGDGRADRLLGEALEPDRRNILIASKYDWRVHPSPSQLTESLRASLDRLRTDHVDLLQLQGETFTDHDARAIGESGMLDWADEMQSRGLCRLTGITAEQPTGALERLLKTWRFDVLQIAYNIVNPAACDPMREPSGVVLLARELGMGIIAMRCATSGFLQRLLDRAFPGLDRSRLTSLAINYVLSTPQIDCALVGMKTSAEVDANCDLAEDQALRLDVRALHNRYV
jgi:aryl-alcohol dehydrogenase-like predicted oxidoreductase